MTAARPLGFPPDDARAIVAYNRAVFERYLRRLARLPTRTAVRDRGIGHGSLVATLAHILNVHQVWIAYIARGRGDELETLLADASRHPKDLRGLRAHSRRVWREVAEAVDGLDGAGLARTVTAPWMPGEYTVRDALLQATLEQAHHLGEIIGVFWQDDRAPPEMTWLDTKRQLARARRPRR